MLTLRCVSYWHSLRTQPVHYVVQVIEDYWVEDKKLIKQELQIQQTDVASAGAMHFYPAMAGKNLGFKDFNARRLDTTSYRQID